MRVWLLISVLSVIQSVASLEFYVGQGQNGSCEPICLEGNLHSLTVACCSIEQVAKQYGTNTSDLKVHLFGNIKIMELVMFENVSSLTITGNVISKPELSCGISSYNSRDVGLQFFGVQTLEIYNVRIVACGAVYFLRDIPIITAVAIVNCRDVLLDSVDIESSKNNSLLINNANGEATLRNLTVQKNVKTKGKVEAGSSFAGGIQIVISNNNTTYTIIDSQFASIHTPLYSEFEPSKHKKWLGYGLGGALSVIFEENVANCTVSVVHCTLQESWSPFGGCMYIRFQDKCTNNSVVINDSVFRKCKAMFGGGGLAVGVTEKASYNRLLVNNTTFKYNDAKFGGGTYLFAFHSRDNLIQTNDLEFVHCNWIGNTGRYSSAVDISPSQFDHHGSGNLPNPIFQDCNFVQNQIVFNSTRKSIAYGVFVITRVTIRFNGLFLFDSNAYTALLLNSARIEFGTRTEIRFVNNTGFYGGAVSLHSFSSLSISNHSFIQFINNTATEYGGAIFYHTTEQREFFASRSCFLEYSGSQTTPVEDRNITVHFSGNSAKLGGSSIFASTFFSCYFSSKAILQNSKLEDFLKDIGNFTLDTAKENNTRVLSTLAFHFETTMQNKTLFAWPGSTQKLSLTVVDEFNHNLASEFYTRIRKENNSVSLQYPYTVDRSITLFGAQGDEASLIIATQNPYRIVQYILKVTLLHCPPGFYYDELAQSCKCSSDNKQEAYYGIEKCNHTAIIKRGYWAGYYTHTDIFYTTPCTLFCNLSNNPTATEYPLPGSNNHDVLNLLMCGQTRQGVVCGQCRDGFSTFYHSKSFTCGEESKCSYGIFLFIVSELLPVFIFFTLSIIFEVNFSSGASNGFIFYCQIVTIIPSKYTIIDHSNTFIKTLVVGYNLFYGIFNFDFFSVEQLSFCLFKGATVMNVLAFKYVTTVFAFILVILLIVSIRYCTCCSKYLKPIKTIKVSVLHGLSAFFVISYAECVRVSLFILRKSNLIGAGGTYGPSVAYFGGIKYFENEHTLYAIISIFTLFLIGFVPCFVLLFYPSFLHLLQLCKLSENKMVLYALRVTRINSLMPMFDIFQGGFKDRCRFFAGLYFFYRIVILVPFSFSSDVLVYGLISELFFFLMLSTHSVIQPYKERKHNVYDSLLFSNLILITGFGVVLKLQEFSQPTHLLKAVAYSQLFLIYIPIIFLAIVFTFRAVKKLRACRKTLTTETHSDNEFLEYLDILSGEKVLEGTDVELSTFHSSYKQCETN